MRNKVTSLRRMLTDILAISMLAMIWILMVDFLIYHEGRNLMVCLSVILMSVLIYLLQPLFNKIGEYHPVLEWLMQYIIVVVIFIIFKEIFSWYKEFKLSMIILYTLPVFAASYGLRLLGIRRDAKYINKMLKARQKNSI